MDDPLVREEVRECPPEDNRKCDALPDSCTLHRQGAEARIWKTLFLGRVAVVKERFKKSYRHPLLDSRLTLQRMRQEIRCMLKARKLGVLTPTVFYVNVLSASMYMEFIEGETLKHKIQHEGSHDFLYNGGTGEVLMRKLGALIARLHDGGVIHGDLTSSNVIVKDEARKNNDNLVIIDFGLSFLSKIPEDRAVDLYVFERALLSAHASCGTILFDLFWDSYRSHSKNWCSTLNRLGEVRMRGRKRTMVG